MWQGNFFQLEFEMIQLESMCQTISKFLLPKGIWDDRAVLRDKDSLRKWIGVDCTPWEEICNVQEALIPSNRSEHRLGKKVSRLEMLIAGDLISKNIQRVLEGDDIAE